ncbi:hypothetical protein BD309DRAFT_972761 [Dichomitus squalens]|uniref:Uncharacterized protein n=1 Tax=Dichomitus squalens TaxID=114155 RepID=A0A4Q9PSR3_9APHY|nr:hypothetical protein BD309DRAFT_972761 [Dichomitus squalens]TBU57440.1 hypothetical protein BD310DRAFT_929382 [Dichomitus squalens]
MSDSALGYILDSGHIDNRHDRTHLSIGTLLLGILSTALCSISGLQTCLASLITSRHFLRSRTYRFLAVCMYKSV